LDGNIAKLTNKMLTSKFIKAILLKQSHYYFCPGSFNKGCFRIIYKNIPESFKQRLAQNLFNKDYYGRY